MSIEIFAGNNKDMTITVYDVPGLGVVPLTAIDDITWQLYPVDIPDDGVDDLPVIDKSLLTSGVTLVGDGTAGQFVVSLDAADTEALSGAYQEEINIFFTNGDRSTTTDEFVIRAPRYTEPEPGP